MSVTAVQTSKLRAQLGNGASPVATGIARLYVVKDDNWVYTGYCGIVALVIDRELPGKPYFIMMYDAETFEVIFSEEIYVKMPYKQGTPQFHYFQGKEAVIGLSFALDEEKESLNMPVKQHSAPTGLSGTSSSSSILHMAGQSVDASTFHRKVMAAIPTEEAMRELAQSSGIVQNDRRVSVFDKIRSIFKGPTTISSPTGFKHVKHIGGFDINQAGPIEADMVNKIVGNMQTEISRKP